MRKILTITSILVITLMLSILPVFAAETVERHKNTSGKIVDVSDITNADTIHANSGEPTVNIKVTAGENEDTVVVTYYAAELKIVENTEGTERPSESAWLGVRLTPKDADSSKKYTYVKIRDQKVKLEDNGGKSFDYYAAVRADKLKEAVQNGEDLVYTETITWLTEENTEETNAPVTKLTVIVKADKMEVYDKTDEKEEWNEESYNTAVAEYEAAKKAAEEAGASKDKTPKTGI